MKTRARLALLAIVLVLGGCSGLPPVYSPLGSQTYRVKQGDTLYAIAFRYGLDYKSVAQLNGIAYPYVIYPNQVIRLSGSARQPEKDSGPVVAKPAGRVVKPAADTSSLPAQVGSWRWPLEGRVLQGFSLKNPINKGIDIAGRRGDKVVAAADGVVVYAGGNLRGYGKLVIIKHSDNYLSAYGNNRSLLVKEGDAVSAGKTIARVGSSASDEEMLHFEIRRDGKPEDPMKYLPPSKLP